MLLEMKMCVYWNKTFHFINPYLASQDAGHVGGGEPADQADEAALEDGRVDVDEDDGGEGQQQEVLLPAVRVHPGQDCRQQKENDDEEQRDEQPGQQGSANQRCNVYHFLANLFNPFHPTWPFLAHKLVILIV